MAALKRTYVLRNDRPDILARVERQLRDCYRDEGEYDVIIRPHRAQRSLDQNAYFHGPVLSAFCDATGYSHEEMKEVLKDECAEKTSYRALDGMTRYRAQDTSRMNVGQFSEFLERCIALAGSMGIAIPPPTGTADYNEEAA